jgi:hypothetical protein
MLQRNVAGRSAAKSDIVRLMTDTPDFAALAREYLDLWQDQLTAMAADPALAAQSARFFEAMGQAETAAGPQATAQMAAMAQQFMTLAGLATGGKADDGAAQRATPEPARGPSRGAAPPAAAPDDSHQQLAELASRLAALEERLDRMETGSGGARGSAKSATGKRAGAKSKSGAKRKQSKPKSK